MKTILLASGDIRYRWMYLLVIFGMLTACQKESRGFVLPAGDVAIGKATFSTLYCTDCHHLGDMAWTGATYGDYPNIQLGGDVTKLKTYGELVTSVINPSHKISQRNMASDTTMTPGGASKMETRCYNDVMTVQQLVDIVAFLQSEYKLVVPTNTYPYE